MRTIRLNRWHILIPIAIWWAAFLVISNLNFNRFELQNILGFLFLVIVPGLLTVMLIRIEGMKAWGYVCLIVGFSLLELMLLGLLGNTFLPFLGIVQPLSKSVLLLEVYLLTGVLAAVTWLRARDFEITVKRYLISDCPRDWLFLLFGALFVVFSIFGAIQLNDGGSDIFTMMMLGGMCAYLVFLLHQANEMDENILPASLFLVAISLLFMTSLRGWYVTGHDIQEEYRVFELAKSSGIWNVAAYQDAYNACLSITILPTMFANLLNLPDPYVYKVFFQTLFGLSPVLVYLISRHWTGRRISLLATTFFIGFPTFYTDMPFLNRQEIAFIFYGLMLYIIFEENLSLRMRQLLFILMGIGVILSHYSTTYTILLIFGASALSRPVFTWLMEKWKNRPTFQKSAVVQSYAASPKTATKINIWIVGILLVLSFLWTSTITQTGGHLAEVLSQTFSAIQDGFAGNNRSIDATSLLTFGKPDQNQELQGYIANVIGPIRASATPGEYFSAQTYSQYTFTALGQETVPLTSIGNFFESRGVDISNIILQFGELLAKLMEVLVPLGMIYLLFRSAVADYINEEVYLISFYCLIFIGLNIVLPVLSTEYGIFRAMQQSMFVIAPVIVIGSLFIGRIIMRAVKWCIERVSSVSWDSETLRKGGELFTVILVIAFFAYSTSFLRQLFGGNVAQLHLSNDGPYYDNYLIQDTEVAGVTWLTNFSNATANTENGVRLQIQTNRFSKFTSLTDLDAYTDIFPGVIQREGYVFLGPATVVKHRATILYNADQVAYTYPLQFLEDNKSLIYNNGSAEVYK